MTSHKLSTNTYRWIAALFVVAVVMVSMAIVNFGLSKAEIVITSKASKSFHTAELTVAPQASDGLSGEVITTQATLTETFKPTTQGEANPVLVTGQVTLVNTSNIAQTLVKRTQLQKDPTSMIYRLDNQVVVPAQGQVTVGVTANEPGKAGELTAPVRLTVIKLNPSRQKEVYAGVKTDFSPGEAGLARLTQADLNQAKQTITLELKKQLQEKFKASEDQIKYLEPSFNSTPELGDELASFPLTGTLEALTIKFHPSALLAVLKKQYYRNLPAGYINLGFNEDSINWSLISVDETKTSAKIKAGVETFTNLTSQAQVVSASELAGLSANKIKDKILDNPNVTAVRVSFWPFWRRTAPSNPNRIKITVKTE